MKDESEAMVAQEERPSRLVRLDVAGATDTGQARARNEDTYLIASFYRSMRVLDSSAGAKRPGWSTGQLFGDLLMVADGMGGQGGGDIASQTAVDAIANYLIHVLPCADSLLESLPSDARSSLHDVRGKLYSALMTADETIRRRGETVSTPSMGTTLTMAFIVESSLYVAHVGDSRCYLFRDGRFTQLTKDHNMANEWAERGGHFAEEAEQLNHILWNCLGGGDEVRPSPEVLKTKLAAGDSVLLCTDGLTNELTEREIMAELVQQGPSRMVCERLVRAANLRGGEDNITVVLARPARQ